MALESPIDASAGWFTGEDHDFIFTVFQGNGTTVQDITGWGLSFMVKAKKTDVDGNALLQKTTPLDIALTVPASGICTVTVRSVDTLDKSDGVFWYELMRTDSGFRTVCAYGPARLLKSLHAS